MRVLKVVKKISRKVDGTEQDYKAGVQLERAAKNALEKAHGLFQKIIHDKTATDMEIFKAKEHLHNIVNALDYL